ncbi:MAG: Gfo/Idh/MocA family oxidoreductase [Chlorobia bacterium]|nr:Gfo/Idh/MocA family oxidoreductase [Fimbriimonadaceae bacterium]
MSEVRFGLIGCGVIYKTHADALAKIDGAKLVAVHDIVHEKACEAADLYHCAPAKTIQELCELSDAVIVCTPSGLHAEVGVQVAQSGRHVMVEKPIDTTRAKAQSLVDAAKLAGVKLATISQHRFSSAIQRTREAAQNGELGDLLAGDAYVKWYRTQAYYDSGDWRGTWALDGGGCLINQGIHMIDMIQWIMGGVKSVQAQVRTASHDIEVEDIAQALIEYKNGAIGLIYGSTSFYPGLAERLEVHGKHGTVILEGDRVKMWKADPVAAAEGLYGGGVMMQPTPNQHTADQNEADLVASSIDDPTSKWGEQHRLQLEDFTWAILDGREPFITGEASMEPLKIIMAIYQSAKEDGRRIYL